MSAAALVVGHALACRPATPPEPPTTVASPTAPPASAPQARSQPAAQELDITVAIAPQLEPEPLVELRLSFRGPAEELASFVMPGPVQTPLPRVTIVDADGRVEHVVEPTESGGMRVRLTGEVEPPLTFAYQLRPTPAQVGETSRLVLSAGSMLATGDALLLLPEAARLERRSVRLQLDPTGLERETSEDEAAPLPLRALSTLSDGEEFEGMALPYELHRAVYVAGPLEHARLDARGGYDRLAAVGSPSYDTRWIAAEIAGLRTEVDTYFRQAFEGQFVTILGAGPRIPGNPPHVAELRGRGLMITADATATWDAQARLAVATTLVQRWIGGRIRMTEAEPSTPDRARALWFHGGVSRFVARELLFGLGLLDPDEYRDELDAIELELATSPLRDESLERLAARAHDPDPRVALDARSLLVARGAMYATWLDTTLRSGSSDDLSDLLGMVVAVAVVDGKTTLTLDTWLEYQRDWVPADARAEYERLVVRGERPRLAKDALGPCFSPRRVKLRRFVLGLVDASTPEAKRVLMVDPEGPAARAGLRPDDQVLELRYAEGDAATEVELTVSRDGTPTTISYLPAGPARPGFHWQRNPGVPDERCARR